MTNKEARKKADDGSLMNISVLIIGSPSLDHLVVNGDSHHVAGGAGLYTALAAARAGAIVTIFAPRPEPMPEQLLFVERVMTWIGPVIGPEEVPRFHIIQSPTGSHYENAFFGAEEDLEPAQLPDDLAAFDLIHVVPLGGATQQLSFLHACRARGAKLLSAGTAHMIIEEDPDRVVAVRAVSDLFFMNHVESALLDKLPGNNRTPPGRTTFITLGENGAVTQQGEYETQIHAPETDNLDPTGAGDTFCGATLSGIAAGQHPVMAAISGSRMASSMITGIGPSNLVTKIQDSPLDDDHLPVNQARIEKIAELISTVKEAEPFPFVGISLPRQNHPRALDFFFVTTLQQFSFWSQKNNQYDQPLIQTIDGQVLKGAFYLFHAYLKRLEQDPDFFSPERQASQMPGDMLELFRADDGSDVMPAVQLHLEMAHSYGNTMLALNWSPESIVKTAIGSRYPLATFLKMLDQVGGYREDPLRKKSALLALILAQRPEKFFAFGANESLPPVVDYHCMRASLRLGLVDIVDADLKIKLENRQLISPEDEWLVRHAVYTAMEQLPGLSGRTMGAVDWFFFMSRSRCPEMTEPDCDACIANSVCAHKKNLFQPVIRTSFY